MEPQPVLRGSIDMFVDDIFDGWLEVPSMGDFLRGQSKAPSEGQAYNLSDDPQQHANASTGSTPLGLDANNANQLQLAFHTSEDALTEGSAPRKRRGHTKSRLGCISCKRRKIKCQEQWPSCANCIKRGCPCRYPTVFKQTQHDRIVSEVMKSPRPLVRLNDTPTMYSANDMRLFHHFLVAAHPCIPHEYESVWVRDVPAFSHQYDYLMHGILALAGSHLSILVDGTQDNTILSHRQKAITGLEEAFTRWPPKAEEAHAMLATSYILAFQSGCMPDGFFDHIISLRGCALISQSILSHRLEGMFSLDPILRTQWITRQLLNLPALDQQLARDALRSLAGFLNLLSAPTTREIEKTLYAQLVESIRPLLIGRSNLLEIPTPDLTESYSETSASNGSSPFCVPSPDTYTKNPLFPDNLLSSYDDIVAQGPEAIVDVPLGHRPDPIRSFDACMSSLMILATWPQSELFHIFSPTNKLGGIIMAHFCSVRFIVSPLSAPESAMTMPIKAMVEWCEKIMDAVDDDDEIKWSQYVQWPRKIVRTLRCCVNQKRGTTFGDVFDLLVKDPGAFREGRLRRL